MKVSIRSSSGIDTKHACADEAPDMIRRGFEAEGVENVDVLFESSAEVDEFQGNEFGWVGPEDIKKVIAKLNDRWVMAANNMGTAENDEAAREWATRMREVEFAQQTLRRLAGGE